MDEHFVQLLREGGVADPESYVAPARESPCDLLLYDDSLYEMTIGLEISLNDYVNVMRAHDNLLESLIGRQVASGILPRGQRPRELCEAVEAGLLPAMFGRAATDDDDHEFRSAQAVTLMRLSDSCATTTRYGTISSHYAVRRHKVLLSVDEAKRVADACTVWLNAHEHEYREDGDRIVSV